MALHHNPRIVTSGLVFLVDPTDTLSWDGSSSIIKDLAQGLSVTKGANTVATTSNGHRVFGASATSGTIDTGYRYGTSSDKVVDSAGSWTINGWIYKSENPNNWWHVYTDGNSGDILTVYDVAPYTFRTSMNNTGGNGTWTVGSDITDYGTDWGSLPNGWQNITLVYDQPGARLQLYINTVAQGWQTGRTIHPDYKLRNFYGWGSAQSSYHTDADHSSTMVYSRVLSQDEITQNYLAQKSRFGL